MCCAPLNAAHFEGRWVWLSFNINIYKDGMPPTRSKCAPLFVSYMMYTGAGVIRVNLFKIRSKGKHVNFLKIFTHKNKEVFKTV